MSDNYTDCELFEDWLLVTDRRQTPDVKATDELADWHAHLSQCPSCSRQWAAHQMLVATLSGEAVPELSPAFEAGLERKLEAVVRVKPLRGWRLAAMAGYGLLVILFMSWIFSMFPLPTINTSSPWTLAVALLAVPFSLWMTAAATRLLPSRRERSMRPLAL